MSDTAAYTGNDSADNESAAQRQSRLRREKRQKMAEQGEDRLARIKALNGGVAPPVEVLGGPMSPAGPRPATVEDPEEVDISQNTSGFGTPSRQPTANSRDDPLAAAMLQMQQQQQSQGQTGGQDDDPMAKMMQQMMGMMGGAPQDPNATPPDLPPMLKALMEGGGAGQQRPQGTPSPTGSAFVWRIAHAVFAVTLAVYISLTYTFNGGELARSPSLYTDGGTVAGHGRRPQLFLIFCTVELLLQSSRYFMEKGRLQGSGMLAQVANSGVVPEPWAGYVRQVGWYVGIFQTILADVMAVVFVFGALAWWNGQAVTR